MAELRNNLFNYATSELSQDAFICWLCSFSLEGVECNDVELKKCSRSFIYKLLQKGLGDDIVPEKMVLKEIAKQKEKIDVLLTVEYVGETYYVILEDKVNTEEHDDQLNRYRDTLEKDGKNVICIYFKTGFQSDYSNVEKAGYKVFNRKDLIPLLMNCNSRNAIFLDFRNYWEDFEKITNSYRELPLKEWPDWQAVNGFFEELQEILMEKGLWAGYDYVNNRGGGFWGLWYGSSDYDKIEKNSIRGSFYLQIEAKWNYDTNCYDVRICTKLSNQASDIGDDGILQLRKLILEKQEKYGFRKPKWMRSGYHMTFGVYDAEISNKDEFVEAALKAYDNYKLLVEEIRRDL